MENAQKLEIFKIVLEFAVLVISIISSIISNINSKKTKSDVDIVKNIQIEVLKLTPMGLIFLKK